MPIISEFYGIIIYMYVDHLPPHLHIKYENSYYRFNLKTGEFMDLPEKKTLKKLMKKWYNEHKEELLNSWEAMQTRHEIVQVKPLD